jgi:hypothetical protein
MSDILSKILGIVLAFILLAFAPLTINMLSNDLTSKRESINEVTNFIDMVTVSGRITDNELKTFYAGCASHGIAFDVKIKRFQKIINPSNIGGTSVSYILNDNIKSFDKGDIVQVNLKAVDLSGSQKLLWQFFRLSQPKFEFTLAGKVR